MIEVNVSRNLDEWHHWWHNFREYYIAQGVDMENEEEITRALADWNAIDIAPESTMFYFEHEHDYSMFMLQWM